MVNDDKGTLDIPARSDERLRMKGIPKNLHIIIDVCGMAIIKLQMFKVCWRENYLEYSSEICYLHVLEHAQVKYARKKSPFSPDKGGAVPYFNAHQWHIQRPVADRQSIMIF
ncbi:hypothetical protein TNCV_2144811 [Trichonephila clavipes]|nr:hypothetical protein TNCV_2144811 [Trichonephila clavipes]